MKAKRCNDCNKRIDPKSTEAIIQVGYMLGQCRTCKRKESRMRAEAKRKLLKGTWVENKY